MLSVVFLTSCAATQNKTPVIVADGTEVKQFENLVFCGNAEEFTKVLGAVGSKLGEAWDQVEGKESNDECTVRIKVDESGNIKGHEVVTCDKPSAIPAVLAAASPIPVPKNQCLFKNVNSVKYGLNSAK
ncbi:hypothetical protein GCM10026915_38970 [Simiduia litorea]